ncbi:MAG: adenylyltransferase/cytidyltransferase family protein [Candidatus Andersenbacteria bacterium]
MFDALTQVRVLTFGSFDPLHVGHTWLFSQAKKHGDHLTVVVARDSAIRTIKQHEPYQGEPARLAAVQADPFVDEAVLGDAQQDSYTLLQQLPFDVLVVGYDQRPSDPEIKSLLSKVGKSSVRLVRLPPHKPEQYKSSIMRGSSSNA